MTEKNKSGGENILSFKAPEPRFPKAAVNFVDALLSVQRKRFENEIEACSKPVGAPDFPTQATSAHILAESDQFIGSGWSRLGHRGDGHSFRWMGRIGTLMLPVDLSEPRTFQINGYGFTKRRFLKETTIWLEDHPIEFSLSRHGFNRWSFKGKFPVVAPRPFHILRLQSPATARLAEGVDAYVSLAVGDIKINC